MGNDPCLADPPGSGLHPGDCTFAFLALALDWGGAVFWIGNPVCDLEWGAAALERIPGNLPPFGCDQRIVAGEFYLPGRIQESLKSRPDMRSSLWMSHRTYIKTSCQSQPLGFLTRVYT